MSVLAIFAARALLGVIFAFSGVSKLRNPRGFVVLVLAYQVLPARMGRIVGWLIPVLELDVALLLLAGIATRFALMLSALLLASFVIGITVNLVRGRILDCGCHGTPGKKIGWRLVLQDVGLLAISVLVARSVGQWNNQVNLPFGRSLPITSSVTMAAVVISAVISILLSVLIPIACEHWRRQNLTLPWLSGTHTLNRSER